LEYEHILIPLEECNYKSDCALSLYITK